MNDDLEKIQSIYDTIVQYVVNYSFQILGAIIIVIAGSWVASKVGKLVGGLMVGRKIDVTLSRFTGGICKVIILVMVAIIDTVACCKERKRMSEVLCWCWCSEIWRQGCQSASLLPLAKTHVEWTKPMGRKTNESFRF